MAVPIGLPQKGAEFYHTSNRWLVGRQCRRGLLRLYFNSSAVSWLVVGCLLVICWSVGWSTMRVPGLWEVSLEKDKYIVKSIILSSFNNIDLSHSMLANCCMRRCQEEGTMAAIGQWRPP